METENWGELLKREIKEVVGCTEPASIAYAVARGVDVLEEKSSGVDRENLKVQLNLSHDVNRNTSTVKVPVVRKKGVIPAAACGLYATPESFNLFTSINNGRLEKVEQLLENEDWIEINPLEKRGVYVEAVVNHGSDSVRVVVRGEHDNVEKIVFNGETLAAPQKKTRLEVKNLKHAEEIMKKDTGELQQIVKKFMEKQGLLIEELDYDNIIDAVEQVVLQRMEGESIRVQTITGSGNQGIFLALPLYSRFQKEGEDFLPAALFSVLVQTYLTRREKRLTDKCGLITKSGPALLAGFLYYRGVDIEEIENRMDLLVESARGVLCEGAKPSCALKAYMSLGMVERIENPEGKSIWKF